MAVAVNEVPESFGHRRGEPPVLPVAPQLVAGAPPHAALGLRIFGEARGDGAETRFVADDFVQAFLELVKVPEELRAQRVELERGVRLPFFRFGAEGQDRGAATLQLQQHGADGQRDHFRVVPDVVEQRLHHGDDGLVVNLSDD